jgi:hypothetical protein
MRVTVVTANPSSMGASQVVRSHQVARVFINTDGSLSLFAKDDKPEFVAIYAPGRWISAYRDEE